MSNYNIINKNIGQLEKIIIKKSRKYIDEKSHNLYNNVKRIPMIKEKSCKKRKSALFIV